MTQAGKPDEHAAPGSTAEATAGFASVDEVLERIRQVHRDVGHIVASDGIEQGRYVELGGLRQWITLRGQSRLSPVLLFLHGGPGDPISEMAYTYQRPWEDFFVVVNWDQRGFGRSSGTEAGAAALLPTLTREQYLSDAIELIDLLRQEFAQQKVIVVGQSWGTVLALELARRRPDLLHIVVTQGLAANWLASPRWLLEHYIAEADRTGDVAEAQRLRDIGPLPPATDTAALFAWVQQFRRGFPDANTWHNMRGEGDGWAQRTETLKLISPEVTAESIAERRAADPAAALARMQQAMAAALQWDAERDVGTQFEVPIVVMMGSHDWQTHIDFARQYYGRLVTPWKKWIEFPHAAHALNVEQPGLAVLSLVNDVLPAVAGRIPAGAEISGA